MKTTASSAGKPNEPPLRKGGDQPIQTGALPGGQPGQGVNTSSSAPGQSNVDASFRQGTDYGTDNAGVPPVSDDERVREAAYRRFLERGSVHGHAEEDWLLAEREVRPPLGN